MSYLGQRRRRARRGMGDTGIVTRPPIVLPATRIGMNGLSSRPPGAPISRSALGDAPRWYSAMYGTSLGDDTTPASATPVLTDGPTDWQASMLSNSNQLLSAWQDYIKKDQIARYVQVAATLAIPLSAAIWRMIFKSGRGDGG